MRYLPGVIDEILEEIPADQTLLRAQLESLRTTAAYSPPELIVKRWQMLVVIFTLGTRDVSTEAAWVRAVEALIIGPDRN